VYDAARLAPVPAALRARWFVRRAEPDGRGAALLEASEALRARIAFRRLNLAAPPFPMSGPLDVIFCRNVLIYFDQATRQRLVAEVERLLAPGGLLCIGHTETLSGLRSGLKLVRPSVFRRAGVAA
jgi:chemotaxis protein methyltransferase CheR